MHISINTICMFRGLSAPEAFQIMKKHGYDLFEMWTLKKEQVIELADQMRAYGVRMSTCCPRFFILNDPDKRPTYVAAIAEMLKELPLINCRSMITQVGQDNGRPRAEQHASIVAGLKEAAPLLEEAGVTLLVEPLNDVKDHKGYYLTSSREGFEIIREVGSPNVRLLYDIYHQVHMGEDPLKEIVPNIDLIGHFHVAGHPKRDAKLFENFDYRPVFQYFCDAKVQAPVGLELNPENLAEAEALLDALRVYEG